MNPLQELVSNFQELVAQVPEIIRPFIVMLAGTIPFIEGELAATIGIVGGLNPIVAAIAAAAGNFLCVLVVVLLTSRARTAVVDRSRARVGAGVGAGGSAASLSADDAALLDRMPSDKPVSKGRQRFNRMLVRFGVPGASILGSSGHPDAVHLRDSRRGRYLASVGPAVAGRRHRDLDDRDDRVGLGCAHLSRGSLSSR